MGAMVKRQQGYEEEATQSTVFSANTGGGLHQWKFPHLRTPF
jgi:hypothetical protein